MRIWAYLLMIYTALILFLIAGATPDPFEGFVCTDKEPDGCYEWRRMHDHQMPESARR